MNAGRLSPILDELDRRLRDPPQLRLALCAVMLAVWYGLIYSPLSARIEETVLDRTRTESHLTTALDIEALQRETAKVRGRIPAQTDPNEWVEYLLGGIRKFPVRMLKFEPQSMRKHGPFDVVVLKVELQGRYSDLDAVLAWIEVNPRLLRIDALALEPGRGETDSLVLRLTVLGIAG